MPSGPEMRSKDLGQGLDRWRVTFGVCFVALPLLVLYSLTAYPGVTGGDRYEPRPVVLDSSSHSNMLC